MAYWYIAAKDELLLDIDDWQKPVNRYGIWGDMVRQRLRDALNAGLLEIRTTEGAADVFIAESNTHHHYHVFIRLARPMPLMQRMTWQSRLGSDWKRSHSDLMRASRRISPASLLIRTQPVPGLWRPADYECSCESGKHETLKQVELIREGRGCKIWQKLRGATPWELFGKPAHNGIERPVNLPIGRVPLEKILEVGQVVGETTLVVKETTEEEVYEKK